MRLCRHAVPDDADGSEKPATNFRDAALVASPIVRTSNGARPRHPSADAFLVRSQTHQMARNESRSRKATSESSEDHPGADTLSTPSWDEAGTLRWSLPDRLPSLLSAPLGPPGNLEQSN